MAENESLDLDSSPRMRMVFNAFRNGASCLVVASKLEKALIAGLRNALKQFRETGVTLTDLLNSRDCAQDLRRLLRKTQGHDYARLFAEVAGVCGPTVTDCIAGWIDAVLDKVMDQICHRAAGSEHYPTMDDVLAFTGEVREELKSVVERLVSKLAEDPDQIPKLPPKKGRVPVNPTADLMNFSLLGALSQ